MIDWFDPFLRRHPRLMLGATIAFGVITTLVLIYNSKDAVIVYRAF